MAIRTYVDANILIYMFEDWPAYRREVDGILSAHRRRELELATSDLTLSEILVKPMRDNLDEIVQKYIGLASVGRDIDFVPVTQQILIEAARLRGRHTSLRLPDAIHAATAQVSGCTDFLTNDKRLGSLPYLSVRALSDFA